MAKKELVIDVRTRIDKFKGPLRAVDSQLKKTQKGINATGSAIRNMQNLALAGISIAGITAAINSTIEWGDEIAKFSKKVGVSAETLQVWRYAAERSGVDSGLANSALKTFHKTFSNFHADYGVLAEGMRKNPAFKELGIQLKGMTNYEDAINLIFKEAQNLTNELDRTRLMTMAFGDSSSELQLMVSDFALLEKHARELNIIMDSASFEQYEVAADKLTDMNASLSIHTKLLMDKSGVIDGWTALIGLIDQAVQGLRLVAELKFGDKALSSLSTKALNAEASDLTKEVTENFNKINEARKRLVEQTERGGLFGGIAAGKAKKALEELLVVQKQLQERSLAMGEEFASRSNNNSGSTKTSITPIDPAAIRAAYVQKYDIRAKFESQLAEVRSLMKGAIGNELRVLQDREKAILKQMTGTTTRVVNKITEAEKLKQEAKKRVEQLKDKASQLNNSLNPSAQLKDDLENIKSLSPYLDDSTIRKAQMEAHKNADQLNKTHLDIFEERKRQLEGFANEIESIEDYLLTPKQRFNKDKTQLDELLSNGLDIESYTKMIELAEKRYGLYINTIKDTTKEAVDDMVDTIEGFGSEWSRMLLDSEYEFKDFIGNIALAIVESQIQKMWAEMVSNFGTALNAPDNSIGKVVGNIAVGAAGAAAGASKAPKININNAGTPMNVTSSTYQQSPSSNGLKEAVLNIWTEDYNNRGTTYQTRR